MEQNRIIDQTFVNLLKNDHNFQLFIIDIITEHLTEKHPNMTFTAHDVQNAILQVYGIHYRAIVNS